MADAVGMTIGDGLEDRLGPVVLTGVDGLTEEVIVRDLIRLLMAFGREAPLLTGEVEADHRMAYRRRSDRRSSQLHRGELIDALARRSAQGREVAGVVLREHGLEVSQGADDDAAAERRTRDVALLVLAVDLARRALDAPADRGQHRHDVEVARHVELRGKPHLDVEDVLVAAVPAELVRAPLEGLGLLQAGDGELEPLEILR